MPGFCVVCGRFIRVDPSRPTGDAPCPNCGTLLWLPSRTPGFELRRGDFARLSFAGRVSPPGVVEAVDRVAGRVRVRFATESQIVLVEVPADAVVGTGGDAPREFHEAARRDPPAGERSAVVFAPIGSRVELTAGAFAGCAGVVIAHHDDDVRVGVLLAGFVDATIEVLAPWTEVTRTRDSA